MNKRILLFSVIFNSITLWLFFAGKQDASSSLGFSFFIVIFWGVSLLALMVLLSKNIIQPKTITDKIMLVTATPVLSIAVILAVFAFNETPASEYYFVKGNHQYKQETYNYKGTVKPKRIEYYRNADTFNATINYTNNIHWLKDSAWIYLNKEGDTEKVVNYKNNNQVK